MAARKKVPAKPEAVPVNTICSVCGLPWNDHGKDPTTDDCIRLLKAELARRPLTVPAPYPVPVPFPAPRRPWYWGEWYEGRRPEITYTSGTIEKRTLGAFNECTPKLLTTTTSAL